MLRRILSRLRRAGPASTAVAEPARRWSEELADAGVSAHQWVAGRLTRDALYVNVTDAGLDRLRREHPDLVRVSIEAAERVLRHEFDLLGSGPYTPDDPDRPAAAEGYRSIDWHLDPISGLRFPRGVPLAEWNLEQMRPGRADVKLPWELARCQHWAVLGQAYRLTGDDHFALEIVRELHDFVEANPVATGVNWTCTMDVALRAANWAIGLQLIRGCAQIEASVWQHAYEALFDHGAFIERHLEIHYGVTSNHFLSNVIGLFFLAAVFDDLPRGRLWNRQCRAWLQQEMAVQILPDGADFESSVPYHRLVTELFLAAARLADFKGEPLPPEMRTRLQHMVDFLAAVERPDGLMPQAGDADDGRVHVLSGYGAWQPQDGRHVFGPAACLLRNPAWLAQGGEWMAWETAWWGFEAADPGVRGRALTADGIRHFPQAGLTVMRSSKDYLLVTNGIVGTAGYGNHKHNDLLAFEYHVDGRPVFVDPGSYVYTSDPDARNLFRGTRSHNTLSVDGEEQNELRPEYLFRMFEQASPEHLEVVEHDAWLRYRGRHGGYRRFGSVVHERTFTLARDTAGLTIVDRVDGTGTHRLRWHFHLAPGLDASLGPDNAVRICGAAVAVQLSPPAALSCSRTGGWYSPSYGVRSPCVCLDFEADERLTEQREYVWRVTRAGRTS